MASWRPGHSMILSLLLDAVVGTKEVIESRQDYCMISDCFTLDRTFDGQILSPFSTRKFGTYYTGSKAEGLILPGSDDDFMFDANDMYNIRIIQRFDENDGTSSYSTFLMSTENVPPGFALLQHLHLHQTPFHPVLYKTSQNMYGIQYLSSDLIVQHTVSELSNVIGFTTRRQGPSAEVWTPREDPFGPGHDFVFSIHCDFWPTEASEWAQRPRYFGWPTSHDISSNHQLRFSSGSCWPSTLRHKTDGMASFIFNS